jgi:hypothetical protein
MVSEALVFVFVITEINEVCTLSLYLPALPDESKQVITLLCIVKFKI